VKRRPFSLLLIAALLVAWHGLILSLPHTHTIDPDVPRFAGHCSAAHPGSHVFHLHPESRRLPPHFCLACLVRSTVAAQAGSEISLGPAPAHSIAAAIPPSVVIDGHTALPNLRAPPSVS